MSNGPRFSVLGANDICDLLLAEQTQLHWTKGSYLISSDLLHYVLFWSDYGYDDDLEYRRSIYRQCRLS